MTYKELYTIRQKWYRDNVPYSMTYWDDFNFGLLSKITWLYSRRGKERVTVNDCYIMADTETSKKDDGTQNNHVVAWTISIRAFHVNIVTLWGRRPSDFCKCIDYIMKNLAGDQTIIYFHNLSYDYVFLRKFLFDSLGYPVRELNTKPHYPVCLTWDNGLLIKDSLILAQRSLDKWAKDYDVEHQKAVGKWQYDRIRTQHEEFTADELEYIEHDTLAGVECLDAMMQALGKNVATAPYTATGIPREGVRKAGKEHRARDIFSRQAMEYDDYIMCEKVYHGDDIGHWDLWENSRTGELVYGEYFGEYQSGGAYIPVTKNYWNKWPAAIQVGVYNKDGTIVPLCKVSGLTEEFKTQLRDHPSEWIGTPVTITGMMVSERRANSVGEGISIRHPILRSIRKGDIAPEDCTLSKIIN